MRCEACALKRYHTPEEWANHPMAGHGFVKETGWSHPQAHVDSLLEKEALEKAGAMKGIA